MRQHRVFIPDLRSGDYQLHGEEAQHLIRVLRVKEGAQIEAFDGQGFQAQGMVIAVEKTSLTLELSKLEASTLESNIKVILAVSLLKADKLALVCRQATELGVNQIQLFTSHYSDVPSITKNKLERLRKIVKEASKQSGRSFIPKIQDSIKLKDLNLATHTIVAHPYAGHHLEDFKFKDEVMIITGPEGGLSDDEVTMLTEKGATAIQFGRRIVRAETAPIALLGAVYLPKGL